MEGNKELYHYGVLGMRWGIRRYQPYSTAPRKSGKAGKEVGEAKKSSKRITKAFDKTIKVGKDKSPISPAEKSVREISSSIDSARKGLEAGKRIKQRNTKKKAIDLSNMTDQELKQKVNRMDLERRYNSLTSDDTEKGFDTAMDILDVAGSVIGVAGGIISAILWLRE